MDVTIQDIQDQILLAYQYVNTKIGRLAGHTVQYFNKGMVYVYKGVEYFQQDTRIAAGTLFVGNIGLFELAFHTAVFFDNKVLPTEKTKVNDPKQPPNTSIRELLLLTIFSVIVIAPNVATSKWLKPKLSPVAMTAIVITSIGADIMVRYLRYGKNIFGRS